jgi:hypothetical protein
VISNFPFPFNCKNRSSAPTSEASQRFLAVKLKSSLRIIYGRHHDFINCYGISVSQMITDIVKNTPLIRNTSTWNTECNVVIFTRQSPKNSNCQDVLCTRSPFSTNTSTVPVDQLYYSGMKKITKMLIEIPFKYALLLFS